ncbi:MAG: hypothetical protein ACI9C1_001303 [Candidatus Aldehydirespiratoraceae bacterium]|jgi:hypothetical protein
MTTPYDTPHDELDGRYWSATRIALGVVVVLMVAMWVWIYYAFVFNSPGNPDRLEARSFTTSAEQICAPFSVQIFEIPRTTTDTTIAQRAEHVDQGTTLARDMIDDVKAAADAITDERDLRLLELWFGDWDAYIDDRDAYHDRLVDAPADANRRDLAFTLTERSSGGNYTKTIEGFAVVNDMSSCGVPGDI